jgi:hypothetical protein
MPGKGIDTLKALKYKVARLEGKSIKQGLKDAGYSDATASHSSLNAVVKRSEPELAAMIKSSDITVDWVVNRLTQELVAPDAKASDRIRVSELLGKYLNMFRDNTSVNIALFDSSMLKDLPPIEPIDVKPIVP